MDQADAGLSADENLLSTGLIDSLGMMKLIGFIEREFNCKVQPQDMTIENFISVEAMCKYLSESKTA